MAMVTYSHRLLARRTYCSLITIYYLLPVRLLERVSHHCWFGSYRLTREPAAWAVKRRWHRRRWRWLAPQALEAAVAARREMARALPLGKKYSLIPTPRLYTKVRTSL